MPTSFRVIEAITNVAGNATSQLLSHAIIQEATKTSLSPIALYVAIPETRHDIKRDKIKLNRRKTSQDPGQSFDGLRVN